MGEKSESENLGQRLYQNTQEKLPEKPGVCPECLGYLQSDHLSEEVGNLGKRLYRNSRETSEKFR